MSERLNVLLCVIDGARADYLSSAGHPRPLMPFVDELARGGVRFTNMVASAPWTLPALASLLTGKAAVAHGAHDEHPLLAPGHRTLPQYLKNAGYRTAAFCTNAWVSPLTGFGAGFDSFFTQRFDNRLLNRVASSVRQVVDQLLRRRDAGARRTNRHVARWLGEAAGPFFALVHYNEAQIGADLPRPYDRKFLPRGVSARQARDQTRRVATGPAGREAAPGDSASQSILCGRYEGALSYIDQRLRELAELLMRRGEWERTLVVVTGDHGTSLGENGVIGNRSGLPEAQLRVPLLLYQPAVIPQGFIIEEIAQSTDVMPTILELLGIQQDGSPLQGRALLRGGRVPEGPGFAVSERFRGGDGMRFKAIRAKREKFIWRSDEANEFYDLISDPLESHNLIEQEVERADVMRRQLFDWLAAVQGSEDPNALAIPGAAATAPPAR